LARPSSEITLTTPTFAALRDVVLAHQSTAISFINTPIRRWQSINCSKLATIIILCNSPKPKVPIWHHTSPPLPMPAVAMLLGSEQGQIVAFKQREKALTAVNKAAELLSPVPQINSESIQIDADDLLRVEVRPSDQPPYALRDLPASWCAVTV
jgi:hypothetical protein